MATNPARTFPILGGRFFHDKVGSIPWSVIVSHEDQAQSNHMQSLETLARRGGLSACEACAVLLDRRYERMDDAIATKLLADIVKERELGGM